MATFDASVLRSPRWIAAIVVAIGLASLFVRLGIWQLDRLEERRARNATITERAVGEPESLDALMAGYPDADSLAYRRAVVTGTYRPDLEFFSIGRTYDDLSGTLVLTPLELADGTLIIVERGLVPVDTPGPPAAGFAPPAGTVVVTGRLNGGEAPLRIGEPDPEDGILRSLSRVDLDYIDTWIDATVLPIALELEASEPSSPEPQPIPIPEEELSEGPHLGYAIQWFAFAGIAIVGVGFLVFRAGTAERAGVSESEQETAPPP